MVNAVWCAGFSLSAMISLETELVAGTGYLAQIDKNSHFHGIMLWYYSRF